VHRDVKPDNVLLSGDAAVVTEFGIAKAVSAARTDATDATLTQVGTVIGMPAYMAPEQATGDAGVDHRADIYSFGCLGHELFTGRPPFREPSAHLLITAHITTTPRPVNELRPDVPVPVADLLAHCLAKAREDRPQNARELLPVLDGAPGMAVLPVVSPPNENRRESSRSKWVIGALLAAILATGTYAATSWFGSTAPITVAVLPFGNIAGDSAIGALAYRGQLALTADTIAARLAAALRRQFPRAIGLAEARPPNRHTPNSEAHRLYLLGLGRLIRRQQTVDEAVTLFHQAIAQDTLYADSGLAMSLALMPWFHGVPRCRRWSVRPTPRSSDPLRGELLRRKNRGEAAVDLSGRDRTGMDALDHPRRIHEDHRWEPNEPIVPPRAAVCVEGHLEVGTEFLHEILDRLVAQLLIALIHGEHHEARVPILLVRGNQLRKFLATRGTPRPPERHDDRMPPERRQLDVSTGERGEIDVGRRPGAGGLLRVAVRHPQQKSAENDEISRHSPHVTASNRGHVASQKRQA